MKSRLLKLRQRRGSGPGSLNKGYYGQAIKGGRRMPWHEEAMKDAVSCDKPRGAAKQVLLPGDVRMGQPDGVHTPSLQAEYIGLQG
jgi:hypothetical protein